MLKEDLEKVLDEYLDAKNKSNTTSEPIAHYITKDIRNHLTDILGVNKFVINSSAGRGKLAAIPWIDIGLQTKDFDNINIAYFFSADMSGVYLVLRTFFFRDLEKKYGKYLLDYIKTKKTHIRNCIKNSKFNTDTYLESIDLKSKKSSAKMHEEGVIISKYYKKGQIPNDDELMNDLNNLIKINEYLSDNYSDNMYLTTEEWIQALENEELISDKMLSILEIMYKFPDYTASTYQIADIRQQQGFENEKSYNSEIVANSKRVKNYFKKDELYDSNDNETFWSRLFYGKTTKNIFYFTLRDELTDALEKYDKTKRNIEEFEIMEKTDSFHEYLLNKGFLFENKTIENYLLSLKVKPFIILTGNSGTGKTKLSQLFAQYSSKSNDNYKIIPVGANWTENRNIVGYYNVLTKSYQHTPSLDLLLSAKVNKDEPYFLILDEMNLSHVERYFSDFLSSMESNKPIQLHESDDIVDVPKKLAIPDNLFIVGTVNVDETTYMFSPKVLDRANVLEFKTFDELDITDYIFNNPPEIEFSGDVDYLENPLSDINIKENILSEVNKKFNQVKYNLEEFLSKGDTYEIITNEINLLDYIIDELSIFYDYLKNVGFEFGYRTVNEILAFMVVAWKYEGKQEIWDNWRRYFDTQILQKILPKLHGSQIVLSETLNNLLAYCLGIESIDEIDDISKLDLNEFNAPYLESAKKLIQMKNILEKQRYVSFIN